MTVSTAAPAQGTVVQISTGTGGAQTISGISVGSPTRLTITAHTLQNGDNIALAGLAGADAAALNGKSFVVKNRTTNTIAIDADTTGLTITAAGTATPQAYSTFANVKDFNGLDGAASEIDVTHFLSTAKEFRLGLQDSGQVSISMDHDGSDAAQLAAIAAQAGSVLHNFKIILTSIGETLSFAGFVKKFSFTGAVDNVYRRAMDIRISGPVTLA